MAESEPKTKRPLSTSLSISKTCVGLFECADFISPNEYSEKTRGLFTSLLRSQVGDSNFSDVLAEIFKRIRLKQEFDLLAMLEAKREHLPNNGASIEKCLMLDRWITYISENVKYFEQLIYEIYQEMNTQMTDNPSNQMIKYPEDFRQREVDFHQRVKAQKLRRLFYYSSSEPKSPSLIPLQNRTTAHLNYLIDSKMRYDRHFRDTGLEELKRIFGTSFMVLAQPHSGANPVIIVERRGPRIHVAKVSVILISLLHDFMQTHPKMIELEDIEVTLCPIGNPYKLDESHEKMSWKTCELKINPNDRPRMIQYAELTSITIRQTTSSSDAQVHFAEKLHSFTFLIKLSLNLHEHKFSMNYQIPLQSLPFGIVTYNAHIPYSLTRVLLDDIQRFAQPPSLDVKILVNFILRYFIHRTGVEPKSDLQNYLTKELTKARGDRSLEGTYAEFLGEFVNQVEFMAKHPILTMFYTEGLFLGPCDSEKSAEVMKRPSNSNSPIFGLRFNSIKANHQSGGKAIKSMKASQCCIRVDIYNPLTNYFQNRKFEPDELMVDVVNFVSTANIPRSENIQILSNFAATNNVAKYEDFKKYYHERLADFHKEDSRYKPIIDLLYHVEEVDGNNHLNGSNLSLTSLQMNALPSTTTVNHVNAHMPVLHTTTTIQNDYLPFNQQPYSDLNDENVMQYVLSRQDLFIKIIREFRRMRLATQPQQAPSPVLPQTSFAMPNSLPTEYISHSDRVDPIEENNGCADDSWPFGDN